MSRKRIWSLKWQTKTKKKKLAIYRAWPWISNCWEWDSNSGLSGIESSALTTRPSRLGGNLRRDATSRLLFLDQSVLADFDPRKKKSRILRLVAFQARVNSTQMKFVRLVETGQNCVTDIDGDLFSRCFHHRAQTSFVIRLLYYANPIY